LTKALKFIKVKCKNCGLVNLIPVYKRLIVDEPVKCEECRKVLARKEKKEYLQSS